MNDSNKNLLDRDAAIEVAKDLALQLDAVDDIVDYGTHLIIRVMAYSAEGTVQHIVPIGVLAKQVVTMLDAVSVLLRSGCGLAAFPNYRALYEAELQLAWMLAQGTEDRARSYWVAHLLRELRRCQSELPGSAYRLAAERVGVSEWRGEGAVTAEIAEIEAALAQDGYAGIRAEVQSRFWASRHGCGGLEQMARAAGRWHEYEVFYRLLSGTAHAGSPKGYLRIGGGEIGFEHVREPKHAASMLAAASFWTLRAYKTIIDHYRAEERPAFARRYAKRWREVLRALPALLSEPGESSTGSSSVPGDSGGSA